MVSTLAEVIMTRDSGATKPVKLDRRFAKLIKSLRFYTQEDKPDSDISSMRSIPTCLSLPYRLIRREE